MVGFGLAVIPFLGFSGIEIGIFVDLFRDYLC